MREGKKEGGKEARKEGRAALDVGFVLCCAMLCYTVLISVLCVCASCTRINTGNEMEMEMALCSYYIHTSFRGRGWSADFSCLWSR